MEQHRAIRRHGPRPPGRTTLSKGDKRRGNREEKKPKKDKKKLVPAPGQSTFPLASSQPVRASKPSRDKPG